MNTITIKDFKKVLNSLPDDYRVFVSSDEEGNNYHNLDIPHSFSGHDKDRALVIYPGGYNVEPEEILPKEMEEYNA